ncbi:MULTISPECIES: glycosyltransferase [Paenibacillus]|uniref:glycosyltransferase n=1 Tax=Paenibacillus TaxID=44249 RepID=UPI0030FAF402
MSLKSFTSKQIYKVAVILKPLGVALFPFSYRQRIKQFLLKKAFPISAKKDTKLGNCLDGVNLIGYARAEMGIGESCRIAARSLDATELSFGIINFTGTNSARMNDLTWLHKEISEPNFNLNIFHINAEQMMEVYAHYGNSIFKDRYNIGYWHWELPDFPDEWKESFSLVDEIWVPSTFIADSISIKSPVPVVKIPHSIKVEITDERDRGYFKLPENSFLFLSMYDLKSYQERKNPQASIRAFQKAFKPHDFNVGLVIKVNGGRSGNYELKELHQLIGEYQNIYLINETLSRNDINALLGVVDSFVSLHRSEGFGLGLAEAMYMGKPVIATGWSSNIDFMNKSNSCLVDYELIQLKQDYGPYKSYQYWADPDIEQASQFMCRLCNDKIYYGEISFEGEQFVKRNLSPQVVGALIQKRLDYISLWKFGG